MSNNPPVCHIPPVQPKTQPQPVNLPSVSPVTNPTPGNLQNAVNQLRTIVNYISGRQGPRGPQGASNAPSKPARWQEFHRTEEPVTITDPTSGASVTFSRINQLVMHDQVTGESWTWNR